MVLEERVRLIGKVNTEIADWLLVWNCSPNMEKTTLLTSGEGATAG